MARAIGLRVYMLSINEKGDPNNRLDLDSADLSSSLHKFVDDFVTQNQLANSITVAERTWFFEPGKGAKELDNYGQISYGTYGFESKFKNNKTKKLNYQRKTSDVEEIPLYYQFLFPAGKKFAIAVFQSFQGRSCVQLVLDKMKEVFEAANDNYLFRMSKMSPHNGGASLLKAPVKRLKLIKRNTQSDLADQYNGKATDTVDVELTVSARRRKDLGPFGSVSRNLEGDGVLIYDGREFDQAVAEVRVGGKLRPVGIYGDSRNAGVIDITDSVIWEGGHPTIESVRKEANKIVGEFVKTLAKAKI
ncbi:hypothetical protein [Sphingopyxis sp. MSC1_008]|jgi:hypothetical protein|uniref:hypothetical protein n=1 Tax=Sphingopyxis sp. MSC1_008 TaxID=2909265 RepID=UPI0020C10807|nr:hypothetical protein [Sphingopyxis sp. MSC1_008]